MTRSNTFLHSSIVSMAALLSTAATLGCSGEGGPSSEAGSTGATTPEASEDGQILELWQDRGYDASRVSFEGDQVRVDDDMVFDRESLLAEAAEGPAHVDEVGSTDVDFAEKAYRYTHVAPGSLCYSFTANISTAWREAFRYAFTAWSSAGGCVRLSECGGGTTIDVGEAGTSSTGTPAGAYATFPRYVSKLGVLPALRIIIDTSLRNSTNTSTLRNLALHEVGHTLGFRHPRDGALIAGTQASTTGCNSSGCIASYPTIMDYSGRTTLQADDKLATTLLWPKITVRGSPVPSCMY